MTSEGLVTLVARQFGLVPRSDSVTRVEGALAELGARLDLEPGDCARRVGDDPVLLRALAGALVVGETYFLRIPEHFACVASHVSERLEHLDVSSPVRVWSAGCSTGEEAYSVAMWLDRYLPPGLAGRVEIVASDVNRRGLAVAETGEYGPWSFRDVGEEWRKRYFEPVGEDRLRVTDRLRRTVRFVHFSVQEHLAVLPAACFDVVLFRNVAIYLDSEARRRVYGDMARVLAPGGLLILAGTDPVPDDAHLRRTDHSSCSVYVHVDGLAPARRKDSTDHRRSRGGLRSSASAPVAAAGSARRPRRAPGVADPAPPHRSRVSGMASGRSGGTVSTASGSRRVSCLRLPEHSPVIRDLQRAAQAHADADRVNDALELAARLVDVDPAGSEGYLLRGQLHLSVLRPGAAVEDLRRAVFVAPENALARYWYVLALWRAGESRQALAQNRELEDLLDGLPAQELLEEGTTVGQLRDAVRSLREGMA